MEDEARSRIVQGEDPDRVRLLDWLRGTDVGVGGWRLCRRIECWPLAEAGARAVARLSRRLLWRSMVSVVVLLSLSWLQPVVCRTVAVESALPGAARRAGFRERAWARH